jgi:hypothetical protein
LYALLQRIGPYAFFAVWGTGLGISATRYWGYLRAYLRQFPPVDGIALDTFRRLSDRPVANAIHQARYKRQPDPEVEHMRREVWKRYWYYAYWIFGFPALVVVVALVLKHFLQ